MFWISTEESFNNFDIVVSQLCPKRHFLLSQGEMKKARRAPDLEILVAGAGFEPTTFGL